MNWKNLKLIQKLLLSFGFIILLIIVVAFRAIYGIDNIITDGEEVIEGNKLRAEINKQHLDHLKWINEVNRYISDDNVSELHIETNHNNCKFGKWLNSEKRKQAEKLIPELKNILYELEMPHEELHKSAIEIASVFEQSDRQLFTRLINVKSNHSELMIKLDNAINANSKNVDIIEDHTKCEFGKWLLSDDYKKIIRKFSDYTKLLQQAKEPHKKLHESVKVINNHLITGNYNLAENYYKQESHKHDDIFLSLIDKVIKLDNSKREKMLEATNIYNNKTVIKLSEMSDLFADLHKTLDKNVMTDKEMLIEAGNTKSQLIIFVVLVIIFVVFPLIFITNSIVEPLKELVTFTQKVSRGDLNENLKINRTDEIGELAKAMNSMVFTLKQIIGNIINGSNNIAVLSSEMNKTSQQIAGGNNETASSTEEISATIEELQANTEQNANNAKATENIANEAFTEIRKGSEAVMTTVNAMKIIAEKTAVINEIANQTNLLSINASVEAARAGEIGDGFAVVAKNIKELSQKSRLSSEEIEKLTKNNVRIADETSRMFEKIVPNMQKTSLLVQKIIAGSFEQNSGIKQIVNAITQLNSVTQQNTAISEEMATSSEELASQSLELKNMISYFKIDNYQETNIDNEFLEID